MPQRGRCFLIVVVAVLGIGYQWLVHGLVVALRPGSLAATLATVNGVPHAALNIFMLWVFGRTLRVGREPLITRFARRIHGTLPPHIERYTRTVTATWCVFFALQVIVSIVLLLSASLDSWSFFVNVMSWPLMAALFVGEYGYRRLRFRDFEHVSMLQGIRSFVDHKRAAHASNGGRPHP